MISSAAPAKAEKSSNFFLGFLFLPAEKREALSAVYAYCRLIDDIVDAGDRTKEQARAELDFWRAEIESLFRGEPTHPVAARLAPAVKRFSLPKEEFLQMIRGCSMDLEGAAFETYADLESYMRGVACSVGRLCVRIFGCERTPRERIEEFADLFGFAFQLTNIIRDVGADLELGRVYLPAAEMRQAGYSREALLRREHSPAFDRLMEGLYKRASVSYQRARNAVDFRDRPALLPAEVMAHIYEALLERIKRNGFRVLFGPRERVPGWRKAGLAGRAWLYCHGF